MDASENPVRRENRLAVFEHVVEKEKNLKRKKFQPNRIDSEDSSPSESELIIDDEREPSRKKKKVLVRLTEEILCLCCEWADCRLRYASWADFNRHLISHSRDTSDSQRCYWTNCHLETNSVELFRQHISYHGYLTRLKNIGQNVLNRNNLPECNQEPNCVIPLACNGYICEWEHCFINFSTIFDFLMHMRAHANNNPRLSKKGDEIICGWKSCGSKFGNKYKLAEHVRVHTKEKIIQCPTCLTVFSNKAKFHDHRKRQLSTNLQSYQCSQCLKLFPSEKLLRDHIRSHINHYKCTMCDMTCAKPSILAKHIRYRHINERPFKCQHCNKSFVAKHNLRTHIKTHDEEGLKCDMCDFECRSKVGLTNHYSRKHDQVRSIYECHCCKKKFTRGGLLTKHLMKVHNYHWPSGHPRFKYQKNQDGIHRLQTVRYESLEVTEEMIKSESMQTNSDLNGVSYNVKSSQNSSGHVFAVTKNDEGSSTPNESETEKEVVITINDVDEHGNILKSEVVQSKEIILPDSCSSTAETDSLQSKIMIINQPLPNLQSSDEEDDVKPSKPDLENNLKVELNWSLPDENSF